MGKICGCELKTEAYLKPELKMKAVSNNCDKELGGEMYSVNENYFKSSLENLQKSLPFREIYLKCFGKNSIDIAIDILMKV